MFRFSFVFSNCILVLKMINHDFSTITIKKALFILKHSNEKWIEKYHEEIPLKNRLFLEFRVGSWLSSIQHSYDMCSKIQRFCFPISEKIIANSFLLGSNRNKLAINEGVIKLLIPELTNIRYN